ncbi:unnamed protein product [Protopolystoma xenopodis]|uniref:Uncharacterized protein n=1 Tax=Protopolystoma xenopodis TaxID=117903 RepID=A0A3S5CHG3_9PLAT|nr:unnamed protein product [Protopolystoma xenopodis]
MTAIAKPGQTVFGLIFGALVWFIVPFSFGTSCGLAYLSLGVLNGTDLLTPVQVDAGRDLFNFFFEPAKRFTVMTTVFYTANE